MPEPAGSVAASEEAPEAHAGDNDELHAHIQGSELLRDMHTFAGIPGAPADTQEAMRVHPRDDVIARGADHSTDDAHSEAAPSAVFICSGGPLMSARWK